MSKVPCVYIITNRPDGVLYIGVTSDLCKRISQHKHRQVKGFSSRYSVSMLVFVEQFETMEQAIVKEKQMKKWRRRWKVELIEEDNPDWRDLFDELCSH